MGSNPLWMTEWLCERLDLAGNARARFGLRLCGVVDLSGREFGVAGLGDRLWVPATENWQRIRDAKSWTTASFRCTADARSLPFAAEFFDAIVAVDCYPYFGTDDLYLNYLVQFVKPGGQIGIAGAGLVEEMPTPVPEHFASFGRRTSGHCIRLAGGGDIGSAPDSWKSKSADTMSDGWKLWSTWHHRVAPYNTAEIRGDRRGRRAASWLHPSGRRGVSRDMKLDEYCLAGYAQVDAEGRMTARDRASRRIRQSADRRGRRFAPWPAPQCFLLPC